MDRRISCVSAPALGDVRTMGPGDTIWLGPGVETRRDWPRYADAIVQAITRGAEARRME